MLPIGPKMFPIPLSSKNALNYCHSEFVGLSANCVRFICRKSSCIAPTSSRKEWIRRDKSPGTEFYALAHLPSPSSIDLFLLRSCNFAQNIRCELPMMYQRTATPTMHTIFGHDRFHFTFTIMERVHATYLIGVSRWPDYQAKIVSATSNWCRLW